MQDERELTRYQTTSAEVRAGPTTERNRQVVADANSGPRFLGLPPTREAVLFWGSRGRYVRFRPASPMQVATPELSDVSIEHCRIHPPRTLGELACRHWVWTSAANSRSGGDPCAPRCQSWALGGVSGHDPGSMPGISCLNTLVCWGLILCLKAISPVSDELRGGSSAAWYRAHSALRRVERPREVL